MVLTLKYEHEQRGKILTVKKGTLFFCCSFQSGKGKITKRNSAFNNSRYCWEKKEEIASGTTVINKNSFQSYTI